MASRKKDARGPGFRDGDDGAYSAYLSQQLLEEGLSSGELLQVSAYNLGDAFVHERYAGVRNIISEYI